MNRVLNLVLSHLQKTFICDRISSIIKILNSSGSSSKSSFRVTFTILFLNEMDLDVERVHRVRRLKKTAGVVYFKQKNQSNKMQM